MPHPSDRDATERPAARSEEPRSSHAPPHSPAPRALAPSRRARRAEASSVSAPRTLLVAPPERLGALAEALGAGEEGRVCFQDPRLALYFVSARAERLQAVAVDASVPDALARGLVAALQRLRPGLRAYRALRREAEAAAGRSGATARGAIELVPFSGRAAERSDAPPARAPLAGPSREPMRAPPEPRGDVGGGSCARTRAQAALERDAAAARALHRLHRYQG